MRQVFPRQKESHGHAHPSPGTAGKFLTPPAYGIDFLDRGTVQSVAGTDSRVEAGTALQRKTDSPASGSAIEARLSNHTGLPDALKMGVEHLSGQSLDDVRVHFNSPRPAQLQALAYTQGTQIHVAPGQERHLPHEAWHVVQQKQGRVKPTMSINDMVINDSKNFEKEADEKGKMANASPRSWKERLRDKQNNPGNIIQRKVGFEFQTNIGCDIADKGVPIFEGHGWKIEGDQGELEFITEPFNEEGSHPEITEMGHAVGEIAEIATTVESIGKKRGYRGKPIPLNSFNKYGKALPYKGTDVVLGIGGWALAGVSASPQVTGGVSLGNIGYFLNQVLSTKLPINPEVNEGDPFLEKPKIRDPKTATAAGSNYARYEELFARAKDLAIDEELEARLDIEEQEGQLNPEEFGGSIMPVTDEEWDRVEGFLTYVFLYLLAGATQQLTTDQTKYLFSLMSRTSFTAMFKALPGEYRILEYFPDQILERTKLGDGYLFKVGLKSGSDPVYRGPTRIEWLNSIEEGRDLLSSALSDNPMVRDSGFGSPALGKYPELEKDVKDGVLIEIRSLPREVTPKYWVPMASTLFYMFRHVQE